MSVPAQTVRARRVTVALRGYGVDARLLDAAARLARDTTAELTGVFFEDIDLLRLAELPVAIEICRTTSVRRRVVAGEITRELTAQAAAAEQALGRVAAQAGVTWSFRVVRGAVRALLEAAAAEADITIVAAAHGALWGYRESAAQADRRAQDEAPVAVVFDASEPAKRALGIAVRLAVAEQRPLTVILSPGEGETGESLREQAQRALAGQSVRYHVLDAPQNSHLMAFLCAHVPSMLVVPVSPFADAVHDLQQRLDVPALLVR